ncbi:Membrane-anchored ubiquitin-fold protein 1 [Rhynchospora pubera]|uniref:Membrane-anchored ubiquitin-fold protein 1 n=1 Tax=Rhynchospora pubera TaxID=906938 RepID=A0AAV8CMH0_9POAL|nr:Membrane-anchored ubiquitin-fold protein 1 [Rhynchospora pubera]
MSPAIRWKDEEAQADGDTAEKNGDEEMGREGHFQIQFHLHDGSDIGPTTHSAETTIGNLKETILPQWPQGFVNAPQSVNDFKLIHGGQSLENDKTLGEYLNPPSAFDYITTIHVVMRPPSGIKLLQMRLVTAARRIGCVIL